MTAIIRNGYVEHRYPKFDEPITIGVRWRIIHSMRTGPFAPDFADGLEVRHVNGSEWSAYREGCYLRVFCDRDGEPLADEPLPCPKVRRGKETRYYCGRWEVFSKKYGWMAA